MFHPYCSKEYAFSFSGNGMEPLYLPENNVWIMKRHIPDTTLYDATNCYPILPLTSYIDINKDLPTFIKHNLLSLTFVSDVFFPIEGENLIRQYDYIEKFKTHYILDFRLSNTDYSKH